jgi:pyruvate dehydrogenase E2 component (dihydrolipoamide acetyltransferase)
MPINILMPALSPTMEKGNLAKWLVKEGDKVSSGDVIAEIETDKATMEVEAVDEGTVAKIVVPEGTADVPVNDLIAVLAGEGEDVGAAAGASPPKSAGKPKAEEQQSAHPEAPPKSASKGEGGRQGSDAEKAGGLMREGMHDATPTKTNGHAAGDRVFASPLARRLAKEKGLTLSALTGSGPHGRIVQRDIEQAAKSGAGVSSPAAAPAGAPAVQPSMSDAQIRKLFAEGSYEIVPHDSMRKTIARRLVEAKSTIPHFYLTIDCRIDKLLALRTDINAAAPVTKGEKGDVPAYKVSVNDMVIKALAMGLVAVPDANVTFTGDAMLRHKQVDVGVAVAIPGGLITPVIRNADTVRLSEIANRMKDFAARARSRKLKPEEYQGGSTAVSNLGMYGIKDFSAVINPPHATILAVGAGEERAVVEKGQIVVGNVMSLTLSCDHRAVDGALGAELLAAVKRLIEAPAGMLA